MSNDAEHELSRLYRSGAREEPPAYLDQRVANAARDAEPTPAWWRILRIGRGGQIGLGAFAVIVLSVSLVSVMHDRSGLAPDTGAPPSAVRTPSTPASEPRDLAQAESAAPGSPALSDRKASPDPRNGVIDREFASAQSKPKDADYRLGPMEQRPDGRASSPAASPEREIGSTVAAPSIDDSNRRATDVPSPSAAVPVVPEIARTAERSADSVAPQSATSGSARALQAPKRAKAVTSDQPTSEPPDVWLERIEKLLRFGHEQDAKIEMRKFRMQYPGHPIPPALTTLVEPSEGRARESPVPVPGP